MFHECNCPVDLYTLPNIDFVGGSTQDLNFYCYFYRTQEPFELSRCTAKFSIINFLNKHGRPALTKDMEVLIGNRKGEESVHNILHVTLDKADTLNLNGKFVYQITVIGGDGTTDIPNQGVMYILNNIDKAAAS